MLQLDGGEAPEEAGAGVEEEEEAAQRELLAGSKAVGETVIRIAKLSEQLKGNEWLDPLEQAEVIAENEMMRAAESIEKAAKRLEDIKKKKNEDSGQVESFLVNQCCLLGILGRHGL